MTFRYAWRDFSALQNIEDYRKRARRILPDMIWTYVESGAGDHLTRLDNEAAFTRWKLRQRCLTAQAAPSLGTIMCGVDVSLPVALAPTGLAGASHWSGDVAAARAAEAAGTRLALSTASCYSIEEVAQATKSNHWFQLYPFADRPVASWLMRRASDAGYGALIVTVDVPVPGNREGERRAGIGMPTVLTPARILDIARRPRWMANALLHRRNVPVHYVEAERLRFDGAAGARQAWRAMQQDLGWDDLRWMRDQWRGRFYIKGILDADDAEKAIDLVGADGIVVSNHGGRQLDRAMASIDALPAISDRIGGRAEIYLDGGVRRAADIVTALCLGATGVFLGRPYLYGLAVAGEKGVGEIIELLRSDLHRTLILMGCRSVRDLDRSWILKTGEEIPQLRHRG
ncbi:alpha-hydroxy-acid oxidizing protein [Sphingobium fuliginis]|jgi:L-lactate dehydrogenase (cytochrome)|uniref:Alpha-hydroxy-acid oxidizing protein n=1 Tax=Sphingobium fuliginis (strain ATCC 27551) TaxID=336203 RepID=A0A292ZI93_SPHSA|nr:alpha-hydroxy acid oxidase [Sphingobium fuliginis]QOT71797.1 alpha-hydroxy-acid oxidizing protein [Sphingobium fuliginis]GAY22515.1 L-lactate dehydrogenase [Sphingobium fuliginis]